MGYIRVSASSDGKLYDAYISYVNNDHDRKFVNFILKPYLENKNAYKVHLNDNDILPGGGRRANSIYLEPVLATLTLFPVFFSSLNV